MNLWENTVECIVRPIVSREYLYVTLFLSCGIRVVLLGMLNLQSTVLQGWEIHIFQGVTRNDS